MYKHDQHKTLQRPFLLNSLGKTTAAFAAVALNGACAQVVAVDMEVTSQPSISSVSAVNDGNKVDKSRQSHQKKTSRENSVAEKRKMRQRRLKRKRLKRRTSFTSLLHEERQLSAKAQKEVIKYKRMSRAFWERWHWELQQRKESMIRERKLLHARSGSGSSSSAHSSQILEINPEHLYLPSNLQCEDDTYIAIFMGSLPTLLGT